MARVKVLRTYRFIDKDPVKDKLQTMLQDEGLYGKKNMTKLAALASLSPTTLDNLFFGPTRKPQHATVMALVTAVGYEMEFKKARALNFEEELVFARAWNKKQAKRLAADPAKKRKPRKTKKRAA
jgi:DNA-binding phage protein